MDGTTTFDVIVIGAGPAGENVAARVREHGLSVVVVESELVGGECSYWACMPSKALLRPTQVIHAARSAPGAREAVTGDVDAGAVFSRRDEMAGGWDDGGQVSWLSDHGIDLVRGHGRLAGERTVEVTDGDGGIVTLHAGRAVVVATGSAAAVPPIPGLAEAEPWGNRQMTALSDVPDGLVVIGGGVVGVEMAQAWRRLGAADVTIVEMAEQVLPRHEPEAAAILQQALEDEGIVVRTGVTASSVERSDDGRVTVSLESGGAARGAEVLVATGRRPRTDDVGLDTVGLEPGDVLEVDDQLRVSQVGDGWLYAVGDVNGRALVTHQGKYQARIAGDVIGGVDATAWADHAAVPGVVFTDPEVASVGSTEAEAEDHGLEVRTASYDPARTAGAALLGDVRAGMAKLVIDDRRDVVVGATFVGPMVGEMLHAATVAIVGEVTIDRLWHAVPAFPTVSEVWLRLLEADRESRLETAPA